MAKAQDGTTCTVSTTLGPATGRWTRDHWTFGGIPYALPPVGNLMFAAPSPPARSDDAINMYQRGYAAPQVRCFGPVGRYFTSLHEQGDNYLSLTVRSPELGSPRLPVFVWIHGGGFALGSGCDEVYQGGAFARSGVVEVLINYRLGIAGWAVNPHSDGPDSANRGLLDQIFALRWIQDNIEQFGGDASLVTVGGHSAGAMSVVCLMASPAARNLFRQSVVQSPAAPYAVPLEDALGIAKHLCDMLGDIRNIADLPRAQVLEAQRTISEQAFSGQGPDVLRGSSMAFMPVTDTPLIPEAPLKLIAEGASSGITMLAGWTDRETMLLFEDLIDSGGDIQVQVAEDAMSRLTERQRAFYHERIGSSAPLDIAAAITTDTAFALPTWQALKAQAPWADVYRYRSELPCQRGDLALGSIHGSELPYVFQNETAVFSRSLTGKTPSAPTAATIHGLWASFATCGRPAAVGAPPWPIAKQGRPTQTMILSECFRVEETDDDRLEALLTG
jgi:para-nitrobenzyl esterase